MEFGILNTFRDETNHHSKSPDWHGPGWYRLGMPAGTTIPEEPVQAGHCNTYVTGWLNGNHPAPGNMINGTVCFNRAGITCYRQTQIQIKHCNEYFLYYLPDPPGCTFRYCASNSTVIGIHI